MHFLASQDDVIIEAYGVMMYTAVIHTWNLDEKWKKIQGITLGTSEICQYSPWLALWYIVVSISPKILVSLKMFKYIS